MCTVEKEITVMRMIVGLMILIMTGRRLIATWGGENAGMERR